MEVFPVGNGAAERGRIPGVEHVSTDPRGGGANHVFGISGVALADNGSQLPCAVSVKSISNPCVIRIHGMMTYATATFLEGCLRRAVESPNVHDLTIDLIYCECLDATGLTLLLQVRRDLSRAGAELRLSRPTARVKRFLDLTRTGDLFGTIGMEHSDIAA